MKGTNDIAAAIRSAYAGKTITPIRGELADVDAAYAAQETNTALWISEGRQLVGRKIGLTSEAVQRQLGVDQPDYGMLFADIAVADGGTVAAGHLLQPKVEAEIAIVLSADLDGDDLTEASIIDATDYLCAAIEIVDSRTADWKISLTDTIADNASSAMFVLGAKHVKPADVDVVSCRMALGEDGEIVSRGSGSECMGSPYRAALWLARKMVAVGRPLRKGDVLLSGALGPMVLAKPGSRYEARIDGFGSVSVAFAS